MQTNKTNLEDFNLEEWGNIELSGFDDSKLLDPNLNRVLANKLKAKDPKWLESLKEATSTDEYRKNVSAGHKRFWDNVDQSHRDYIAERSFEAKITFESEAQAHEIFWQCWGPDRGEKLYKQLAKKYNVGYEGIINLVRGGYRTHAYCPVTIETLEQMKKDWNQSFQTYKVYAVRPGYEHLNNYDRLYQESSYYSRATEANRMALPSVVFHCRFILENPTIQSVREYCDSIGIPKENNDNRQYKVILDQKFPWLRNGPCETFEFDSYEELAEFMNTHEDNKNIKHVSRESAWDYVKHRFQWKGENFQGWMFYKRDL